MANSSKLGRGLDILLGQASSNEKSDNNLKILGVNELQRGQFQPRDDINPDTLNELANSISAQGIIQPLVARKITYDKYEIIAGERRWRAAKIAGLTTVPVIVREINDQVALAIGLIENIQREALTPLEEAKALRQLIEDFKMTHEEISHVVGRSRSSVSNLIRLLQLGDDAKQLLSNGDIEMGHGRALLPLSNEQQFEVGNQVVQKSLSVRQTEELVKRVLNPYVF
jgi:ParB family chromosome partitioning protein